MRRSGLFAFVGVQALMASSLSGPSALAGSPGPAAPPPVVTEERPFLVPLLDGAVVQPILTTGDVVGEGAGAYQMSGIPDGLGWFESSKGQIEVFMNHELHGDFDPSGARVSHLTLNASGQVLAAEYVVDGTEGYEWFCSSTLEVVDGIPWYTTGEESKHSSRKGVSIAIDASTGEFRETPWFGHFGHENVVPVQGLSQAFYGLPEDGFSEFSQLFAYIAPTFDGALSGEEGAFRVWVPNRPVRDDNPSDDDLQKGERMRGHFERVPNAENLLPLQLEKRVQDMGAFDFNRIEDMTDHPTDLGTIYFAETGRANQEVTHGRIYRIAVDPEHPRRATLEVVLDAAAGDDIFNPDNLGISERSLVIQEDRNWKMSGFNRVLVYDLGTGSLTAVARTDPSERLIDNEGPGAWESSGVVDASEFFGEGWWLLDVQAHDTRMSVPDQSLEPDTGRGEGGQLMLLFVPGS
jgi:hypothetical protein